MFSLYLRDVGNPEENIDAGWVGRQGIALGLLCAADVLRTKDLPVVMTFLISRALVFIPHFSQASSITLYMFILMHLLKLFRPNVLKKSRRHNFTYL